MQGRGVETSVARKWEHMETSESRILDVTASMQGSLVFQESVHVRISGHFDGSLQTKGDLTIGEQAVVKAEITGEAIPIAGQVAGKVLAKNSLKIVASAVVSGEIWTPVLCVEEGAHLDGTIHMLDPQEGGWMSTGEVAEYLEVEIRLVEQWARENKIPAIQEGGQWRFEKAKIDNWVAAQRSS